MIRHEHETPRSHCDSHLAARVEDAAERQVVERGEKSVFSMVPYAQVSCRGDADGGEETTEDVFCMELFDAIQAASAYGGGHLGQGVYVDDFVENSVRGRGAARAKDMVALKMKVAKRVMMTSLLMTDTYNNDDDGASIRQEDTLLV